MATCSFLRYFKRKLYLNGLKKNPGLSRGFCHLVFFTYDLIVEDCISFQESKG